MLFFLARRFRFGGGDGDVVAAVVVACLFLLE